ncbi:phosphotransferase enzyme family protein [Paenibacillus tengchongensis]|uniref:phosphotransferase enzyme family protein n=1 Tax=Paenibacillus tengchongensis TaxID=2608684 RepID=UPI00124C099A|nr:phosphotransferase [Paenibacillus tengchongensis]
MNRHWPEWSGTLQKRSGGWNNTTYIVGSGDNRAVLRIYNTHRDMDKIRFEHTVLQQLAGLSLPFGTPLPITAVDGETLVQLENGKYACLFRYIEGDSPGEEDERFYESLGSAAGILSQVLATIHTDKPPVYRPYYELREAYPLCTDSSVRELCLNPPQALADLAAELEILYKAYTELADSLSGLAELPHQLVHGDLNASNLLVKSDDHTLVAALLDFEFCTWDLRVMEPAVILSGLVGHGAEEAVVRDFWTGFSGQVQLSGAELEAIPALMVLRKVDVFLHFTSRFFEGTDGAQVLREQVKLLSADLGELSASAAQMMRIVNSHCS